jgi:hypothetical protein
MGAEPAKAWLVRSVESGNAAINDMLGQKLITDDKAQKILAEMLVVGLENMPNIFNKILRFKMPTNFSPSYRFDVCNRVGCPRPLVHGIIYDRNGGNITRDAVSLLTDGFEMCEALAQIGDNILEAIALFQQMLTADLPADKTKWYERYKTLPEETRYKFEEDRGKAIVKELFERLKHSEKAFTDN